MNRQGFKTDINGFITIKLALSEYCDSNGVCRKCVFNAPNKCRMHELLAWINENLIKEGVETR